MLTTTAHQANRTGATAGRALARRSGRAANNGFTLVEVLVAMMIMAIMAVMAWQGVDGIVRARDASQERLERQLRLNTVLAQWEQDLSLVQRSLAVPALTFDGSTLRLTRATTTGMQVVAWAFRGNSWMRWAGPSVTTAAELQESWMRTQQLLGNEAGQLRVLGGLTQWQLYFFRGNAWTNAQSSDDVNTPEGGSGTGAAIPPPQARGGAGRGGRTSNASNAQLPSAVRFVMTFDGNGLAGTLTRDIMLGPQQQ